MTTTNSPFHTRLLIHLVIIFLLGWMIYVGSSILLPILFAITLAMLLLPVVQWLNRKGVKDIIAIILALLGFILLVAGILFFLSSQIAGFLKDLPAIKEKLNEQLASIQQWISENFNIDAGKQKEAVKSATSQGQGGGAAAMLMQLLGGLAMVVLLPIYTFLILFYRKLLHRFFLDVFPSRNSKQVEEVLVHSQTIVNGYMVGLLIEMVIVTILNTIGFLVVGAPYAVFLAVLAAILNLIPYVGMLIASVICIMITLTGADSSSSSAIWVGVILVVVQFIDNNFIMPYIVSSKVKINALVSIIGVLIGGALAGVGGMFLSIPGLAVLKAIFDRVDTLQPWGRLLGDESDEKKSKRKKKSE
jgi:predicted PurR-regulated permease PerM